MSNSTLEEKMEKAKREVVSSLLWSLPLGFLSVAAPILAFFGVCMPGSESTQIWFQRSGALTVLFAVWMEYILSKSNEHINLSGVVISRQTQLSKEYKVPYRIIQYLGILLAIVGTVIWGYGDLIYSYAA